MGSQNRLNTSGLLPNLIDEIALSRPEAIWAEYPKSKSSYVEGFTAVTYRQFANAINGTAWWLRQTFGQHHDFPTLAYIGPNDVRYQLLLIGAIKAGFKMFFTSPRNSIEAHKSLFAASKCCIMLTTDPQLPPVTGLLAAHKMETAVVPSLEALLHKEHPAFPYHKTYEESHDDPIYVLHTSGSTGIPKPLIYTHDWVSYSGDVSQLQPPDGFECFNASWHDARIVLLLPPFHIAGLYFAVINAVFNNCTIILPLPAGLPTADGLVEALNHVKADSAFLAPSTIEDISKSPKLLGEVSSKLDLLFWSGGNLPKSAGDIVASRMHLYSCYGSSEYGAWPELREKGEWPKQDWNYFRLHPELGAKFRHRGHDMFELVLPRNRNNERLLTPFLHFPDLRAYPTNDLFTPHPTKPDFWHYRGRNDDIIVFLNGEKTNPISFEGVVSSHPEVSAALMVGSQRMEAALIVELAGGAKSLSTEQRAQTLDRIWPKIEEANRSCPAHARIDQTHVLFADVPFLRAGKGTVQRKPTLQQYASRIDGLYNDAEKTVPASGNTQKQGLTGNTDDNIQVIVNIVKDITNNPNVTGTSDLFGLGMDSVHVLQVTRKLREAFACSVSPATVYLNTTPASLEAAIRKSIEEATNSATKQDQDRTERMEASFQTFASKIDMIDRSGRATKTISTSAEQSETVILTGSTGNIGNYLLDTLMESSWVQHVYCLNRSEDSRSVQIERSTAKGLSAVFPKDRVTFVTADLANPQQLGIEPSLYQKMLSETTLIMHNAWPVNWDSPLSFFTPQLSSIVNLVAFAASASRDPRLFFLSSISSVYNSTESPSIKESITHDFGAATPNGYGEAKLLGERLLDYAARELHIPVSIARVCQLAGAVQGPADWKKSEWFPSMVISSKHIRAVPDSLDGASGGTSPTIDWIPVDSLPSILLELAFQERAGGNEQTSAETQGPQVFQVSSPDKMSWSALLPTITSTLTEFLPSNDATALKGSEQTLTANRDRIEILPYSVWLNRLRSSGAMEVSTTDVGAESDENLFSINPGLKMLGFYAEREARTEPEPTFDTAKARAASPSLNRLQAVKPEWMEVWVRNWMSNAAREGESKAEKDEAVGWGKDATNLL